MGVAAGGVGGQPVTLGFQFLPVKFSNRVEMEVALQVLFERLPDMKLATVPHYRDAYHFHGLEELKIVTRL